VTGLAAAEHLHPVVLHHIVNTLGWRDLRPLQAAAIEPILSGLDVLLLAPTAGGKTEAAVFPVLTRISQEQWRGLSVLYICPLRALLNNLLPRIEGYAGWLGLRAALWHGDVGEGPRRRVRESPPDILLTTPESLEAMLVSTRVDPRDLFGHVRVAIVDEVHAFAGDDRGWHLLAVLERLCRLASAPVQRIGLSATVGNPRELLTWLQGSRAGAQPSAVVEPGESEPGQAEAELDYVGSLTNAASVIAALHRGEKRLVFCDSRRRVEELAVALRGHGVQTFLSHSSLSADERRRAESAFTDARDCVIVATSTLELGIDVGDLDRVIQVDAPATVASLVQRLGRTGRRAGTPPNCLFLATDSRALLQAAGLLRLWRDGWLEPSKPPPEPLHILGQQVLAVCLQEGRVGENVIGEWWNGLPGFNRVDEIVMHLLDRGYLDRDSGMLFVGPEAEARFGRRNFMELTSVFTADPEFAVLHGRSEIGRLHPLALTARVHGARVVLLGGNPWRVTHIDWRRRRCFVEPSDLPGQARWRGFAPPLSFELCRSMRSVAAGQSIGVPMTRRASAALAQLVDLHTETAWPGGTVVVESADRPVWWTWSGVAANASLAAVLGDLVDGFDNMTIRLRRSTQRDNLHAKLASAPVPLPMPEVGEEALRGLKFAETLRPSLARAVLASRLSDPATGQAVLAEPRRHSVLAAEYQGYK
jgi:ATP-dependent helicase Lhr and Lhr-like helicase